MSSKLDKPESGLLEKYVAFENKVIKWLRIFFLFGFAIIGASVILSGGDLWLVTAIINFFRSLF